MIFLLRNLFHRYRARHLSVSGPSRSIAWPEVGLKGHLDVVSLSPDSLLLKGWTQAAEVELSWGGSRISVQPDENRLDVAATIGAEPNLGFTLRLPRVEGPGAPRLKLRHGSGSLSFEMLPPRISSLDEARIGVRFARDMVRTLPPALTWRMTGDARSKERVKRALGLDHAPGWADPAAAVVDGTLLAGGGPAPLTVAQPVTIVLPVYNAFDLLGECLDRVLRHTDLPWRLILVDDASPDPQVRPFLRAWAQEHGPRVELLENEVNLGFIGSVNRGFARARELGGHVVLLNSDAFVPSSWASRLLAPILRDPTVATVTPMSNSATILTVPHIEKEQPLAPGQADRIDATAQGFHTVAGLAELPTGVGFCMAMNGAFLRSLGDFDTIFGRGYGEEVDWCLRATAKGGRHIGLPNLFVEHRGSASFGTAERNQLIQHSGRIISTRYPGFDAAVQAFVQRDPLLTPRLALALAWCEARNAGPTPVFLAHSMGGGAEIWLQERIKSWCEREAGAVVLRVGGLRRWRVEVHVGNKVVGAYTDDTALVRQVLQPLRRRHLVYSCAVGDPYPIELPDVLLDLRNDGSTLECVLHDFFMISPSFSLLDEDGRFRGLPSPDSLAPAHRSRRPDGRMTTLRDWQAAWGRLLSEADEVIAFSQDSRTHLVALHPRLGERVRVVPHRLPVPVSRILPPQSDRPVIGVLGNIGYNKGAKVLSDLAACLSPGGDVGLVLVGLIDPNYRLPNHVPVHGRYRVEDIAHIVRRYGITCWLVPSICPETFSFATHEALATGMPVYCFGLGAQAEAVSRAPNGTVLPLTQGDMSDAIIEAVRAGHRPPTHRSRRAGVAR
jgi:GT2 family glycosyltransferase/glycosyltransferase involved in cell wall biosynthesis